MTASDIISAVKKLREDGIHLPSEEDDNRYLEDIGFKFLPKKSSFEDLLGSSIILLEYFTSKKNRKQALCTSNKTLIKVFQCAKPADRRKAASKNIGVMRGRDPTSVQTWDLASNHVIDIPLNIQFNLKPDTIKYKIILRNTPENILAVDLLLRNFLKK